LTKSNIHTKRIMDRFLSMNRELVAID